MRRLALLAALCAALLALFAGSAGAHVRGPDGSVWVVNRDRGEVTIFDAASGAPKATVATGAGAHDVAISRRTQQAYVTNEFDNTVSVLSARTLAQRAIPLGPGPHHVEPAGDGRTMLVGLVVLPLDLLNAGDGWSAAGGAVGAPAVEVAQER